MYLIGLDSRYYRCIQRLLSRGSRSSTRRSRSSTWPPSSAPSGSPSSTTKPSADCCPAPTPSRPETHCLYAGQRIIYNAQSEKPEGDFFDAGKLHCGQGRHNAQSLPARTPKPDQDQLLPVNHRIRPGSTPTGQGSSHYSQGR